MPNVKAKMWHPTPNRKDACFWNWMIDFYVPTAVLEYLQITMVSSLGLYIVYLLITQHRVDRKW